MIPEISYNLEKFRAACVFYSNMTNKTESETVSKQGGKLGWAIWTGLRAIRPAKGLIRAERLAALSNGGGIKVRAAAIASVESKYGAKIKAGKTVFGKKQLNAWALAVQREINLRESGKGFLSFSTPRPTSKFQEEERVDRDLYSKYGFTLSNFNVFAPASAERKVAALRWFGAQNGSYQAPVEGLMTAQSQQVIAQAIANTTQDVLQYLVDESKKNARIFS